MSAPYPGNQTVAIYQPQTNFQGSQPSTLSNQLSVQMSAPNPGNQTVAIYHPPPPFQWQQLSFLSHQPPVRMTAPYLGNQTVPIYQPRSFQWLQSSVLLNQPLIPVTPPYLRNQTGPINVAPPGILQRGANNQTLVSLKDVQEKFAIPYTYGDKSKPWPRTTILLYKYSSNAIFKYQVIPEITLQRIDNDPKDRDYKGKHAESILIEQLEGIQKHLKEQTDYKGGCYKGIHTIDVFLNYSPCNEDPHCCSKKLLDFKNTLESDVSDLGLIFGRNFPIDEDGDIATMFQPLRIKGKVTMNITFANFYRHYSKVNMEGLKELLENDIELDILTGDKWLNFFDAVGLDRTTKLPIGRTDREIEDKKIFERLMLEINEL